MGIRDTFIEERGQPIHRDEIDIGDQVICDSCNKDWTGDPTPGGFIFSGHGYCPDCAPSMMESIKKYKEEKYITATCPPNKSHWRWIVEDIRRGESKIIIESWGDENA